MKFYFSIAILMLNFSFNSAQIVVQPFPKLSVCKYLSPVISNGTTEKTICYVQTQTTQYKAIRFCSDNKMKLFNPDSSDAAAAKIADYTKSIFANNDKLAAWVRGRRGKKCDAYNGAGQNVTFDCDETNAFFCEFKRTIQPAFPKPGFCGVISDSRIFGGAAGTLKELPWVAALEYSFPNGTKFIGCAGALIDNFYVLTAASCLADGTAKLTSVILGEYTYNPTASPEVDCIGSVCNDPPMRLDIDKKIPHKKWIKNTDNFDIGLIKLSKEVKYTPYVKPICVPFDYDLSFERVDYTDQNFTIAGWGLTQTGANSNTLLKVSLPSVNTTNCEKALKDTLTSQFCAGGVKGSGTCIGDLGGPVMIRNEKATPPYWYVAGIVPFTQKSDPCGVENKPGIYTRVSDYAEWIEINAKQ